VESEASRRSRASGALAAFPIESRHSGRRHITARVLGAKAWGSRPDREKQEQITALARSLGLAFEIDRITAQPNTIDAHRLSGCAQRRGWQDKMVEALFRAYFMEGIDLNDHDALASLAATVGFDWGQVAMYLGSATMCRRSSGWSLKPGLQASISFRFSYSTTK
jgi:predicted DsbA family dithiol-disulfide isomerase